jgi:gliding motility-associated-like protein
MLLRILYKLLFLFQSVSLSGQIVSTWHHYLKDSGYNSTHSVQNTIVDNNGDYYIVLNIPNDGIKIDSSGTPVQINQVDAFTPCAMSGSVGQIAVVKYSKRHEYLFHLRIVGVACNNNGQAASGLNQTVQRNIDHNNNLILTFSGNPESVFFYNTNTTLHDLISISRSTNSIYLFNVSINQNGTYNWINYIFIKNGALYLEFISSENTYINYTRIISDRIQVTCNSTTNIPVSDTLYYFRTGLSVMQAPIQINSGQISFWISASGNYETNTSLYNQFNNLKTKILQTAVVAHQHSLFRLTLYECNSPDTILYNNNDSLMLGIGYNFVLEKITNHIAIWAKKIYRYIPVLGLQYNNRHRITYDTYSNNIITFISIVDLNAEYFLAINKTGLVTNSLISFDTVGINNQQIVISSNTNATILPSMLCYDSYNNHLLFFLLSWSGVSVQGKEYFRAQNNGLLQPYLILFTGDTAVEDVYRINSIANTNTRIGGSISANGRLNNVNYKISSASFHVVPYLLANNDSVWSACKGYLTADALNSNESVLILNTKLIKLDSSVCYSMQSPSGRYVWDSSGTYRDTIPNHLGCDSLLTVRLQVKHTRNIITQTHCGPLTSPSARFVMDTTGVYKDTLVNQSGCDSLLTINFTQLRQTDTSLRDTFVCSYFVTQRGDTISTNRIFADTLQTSTGCDSIIRYRLHIGDSTATIDTAICSSYTSPSGNYIFTQPGTYFDTITKPSGCNLYYTIHIIQPLLNSTIDTVWCGMFITPSGKVVSPPGVFYDTIPSYRGCDSVLMLRIASSTIQQLIDTSICHTYVSPSGNYQWFAPGVYYDTLTNALGCDTVFEIRIALDTFSVRISKSNELTCQTPDITLTADAGNRFVWSPPDFLNATNTNPVIASPQRGIQYTLRAFNTTGCEATDSITIHDERKEVQLKIANVFTPNDDGLNDEFTVYPQEDVAELNLRIYNRWGALVFETDKPNTTWKGTTSNGTESPSGVYYYIAKGKDRCGKLFEANGTVSLIR